MFARLADPNQAAPRKPSAEEGQQAKILADFVELREARTAIDQGTVPKKLLNDAKKIDKEKTCPTNPALTFLRLRRSNIPRAASALNA